MQPSGYEAGLAGMLSEAEIERRIADHQRNPFRPEMPDFSRLSLRPAAVLVPLLIVEGQWNLLFTRRAETVQSHKGQVSFPGGASDPQDHTPEQTALREAHEEIGLHADDVYLLGRLGYLATVTQFIITPVVGRIRWPYEFQLSPDEVSRIFSIPLDWLADPTHREVRPLERVGYYEDVIYYQPYDGEILWGVTARITVDFLRILRITP